VLARAQRSDENVPPARARGPEVRVGLCAVAAAEADDDELLSQFNTFFILGLADERDRSSCGALEAGRLRPGTRDPDADAEEAIITNLEAPFALPARVSPQEYLKRGGGSWPMPPVPPDAGGGSSSSGWLVGLGDAHLGRTTRTPRDDEGQPERRLPAIVRAVDDDPPGAGRVRVARRRVRHARPTYRRSRTLAGLRVADAGLRGVATSGTTTRRACAPVALRRARAYRT
jgi:hypothetical protein